MKKFQNDVTLSEESERDKLIASVCDRFRFGNLVGSSEADGEAQSFETRMKFRKQKSVMLQIAARVKGKK